MAIRLREVKGEPMAICAAYSEEKPGDIYIDDSWHYALAQKFWRDYPECGIDDEEHNALARKECNCPSCRRMAGENEKEIEADLENRYRDLGLLLNS